MSEDFQNTFCKGHPLGFHWIPIWSSLDTPIILQWVPLRINFVVSIHFARVPLLTISSDLLSFWKKRWSSRYQWSSIYFAGDTLWFHSVSICLQGGGHPLGFTSVVVMHFAQDFDAFPLGLHMVPSVFCKGPHTVGFTSMVCIHFARGTPLGFHWVHLLCKIIRLPYISHGCALGISLDGGIHLQGVPIVLSLGSILFCKGCSLNWHLIPYTLRGRSFRNSKGFHILCHGQP